MIVPLFNAEKYLPVCLESLLIQTLTDFEVLVVDDCSTDSSLTIAESYLERFGERLKIFSLEENTGSPAIPRNVGLDLSQGKYVYFVDADDLLVDNALEELFNAAENFRADVVSMKAGFACGENLEENFRYVPWASKKELLLTQPVLEVGNFIERLERYSKSQFEWVPWSKFLRREALLKHDVKFPEIRVHEDLPWVLKLIFATDRWLRVTTPFYVQRRLPVSFSRKVRSPQQTMKNLATALSIGVDYLDTFMSAQKFFDENPDIYLRVLHLFADAVIGQMKTPFENLSTREIREIFRREFSKAAGSQTALISYLIFIANIYRNELMK